MPIRMARFALIVALASGLAPGCAARESAPEPPAVHAAAAVHPAGTTAAARHENLNAVVWMQSSLEYEATTEQAYRLARRQLDAALRDPQWTAAPEQTGDASGLPPAVIVDVDETVLDNSYYQARMIRDNTEFGPETWDAWCEEARATAVPGAVEFAQHAASRGVTVFYVTNRTANLESATRTNLQAVGFPVVETTDTVLTRGERPEWKASGKGPRRALVAQSYRVLLLIGDDLGDFVEASGSPEERRARTAPHAEWWGQRWIMLPNPSYGSWERAIVGAATNPNEAKRRALRFAPQ
jgi:5'-nucleotidase (lipoprotein e(P4) family)